MRMKTGRDWWWDELMKEAPLECPAEPIEANEPGMVFYTSGTTGKPKGVVHSGIAFLVNNYVYAKYHMDHHPHDILWCTADIGWAHFADLGGVIGAHQRVVFRGRHRLSDPRPLLSDHPQIPGEQDLYRSHRAPHAHAIRRER